MSEIRENAAARKHTDVPRPAIAVRRPALDLDRQKSRAWLGGSAATLVPHALSPMFPEGERFFIKAVMAFKDQIEDPTLLAEIRQFAAQEAAHTQAHEIYDEVVDAHYGLSGIEEEVKRDLQRAWKVLSRTRKRWFNGPRIALAITVGLEHFTALMGRQVLLQQDFLADADPECAKLWSWHASEEIEHKSVAFDVYEAVGGNWLERSLVMLVATFGILARMFFYIGRMLVRDGRLLDPRAWGQILGFLFVTPGIFSRSMPAYLDYFRPGFHPWDHDDRPLLEEWHRTERAQAVA